ncbi:hypothetical protein IB229_05965 [Pseudomonas sp. PDM14]|uniref:hypothetical protein n=1 Tax=Pseudomonas sp. PDM14 TaxID=2769288 RepID=UPI001781B3D7|nr:hypothetical protein [Pseudomonas sp. PDM14]MBD9482505.1 hypothetical protein [Pseudomonas sp. PDM14]
MKTSPVISRCETLLELLPTQYPQPASRCARKTRQLIEIQNEIIRAYSNSQLNDDDLIIARTLIERIADEFHP